MVEEVNNKHTYKVLLIAYIDSTMNWTTEIENISSLHCTTVIADKVIDPDRAQKAAESGDYDVVHFIAHGIDNGILATFDGATIPESTLLRICRDSGARCAFLNSCNHVPLAQRLVDDGVPSVISYHGSLDDGVAVSHCRSFYRELYSVGDLRGAYDSAKGSDGKLIWLSNGHFAKYEQHELLHDLRLAVADLKQFIFILLVVGVISGVLGSILLN